MGNMIVVAACVGCGNIVSLGAIGVCSLYPAPFAKQHILGGCASQTNKARVVKEAKKLNTIKASKRAAAGTATAAK
jgi:hypothetical protein